jgi:hypothetical protein
MSIHTMSSREFNQDVGSAKRLASDGPVFVTDRGRPAHVLLTIEEYQRLTGASQSIVDLLAVPGTEAIEFEPPRASGFSRPMDFS